MSAAAQMDNLHPVPHPFGLFAPFSTRIPRFSEKFMFRALVLVVAFFGITLALILRQPLSDMPFADSSDLVTRVAADVGPALALPEISPAATAIPPQSVAALPVPARPLVDDSDVSAVAQGILTGLGLAAGGPDLMDAGAEGSLQAMSLSALTGLRSATGQPAPAATPLQSLIMQALRAGQSDAYIDSLLNEAATMGAVAVPRALITADGRVDTHVILSTIVAQAVKVSGEAEAAMAAPSGAGVEVRTVQRAGETLQYNFYTVGQGDSLGSIAVKFYGDAARFHKIFDANRALLPSPDKLRVGQRLVIPTI